MSLHRAFLVFSSRKTLGAYFPNFLSRLRRKYQSCDMTAKLMQTRSHRAITIAAIILEILKTLFLHGKFRNAENVYELSPR